MEQTYYICKPAELLGKRIETFVYTHSQGEIF